MPHHSGHGCSSCLCGSPSPSLGLTCHHRSPSSHCHPFPSHLQTSPPHHLSPSHHHLPSHFHSSPSHFPPSPPHFPHSPSNVHRPHQHQQPSSHLRRLTDHPSLVSSPLGTPHSLHPSHAAALAMTPPQSHSSHRATAQYPSPSSFKHTRSYNRPPAQPNLYPEANARPPAPYPEANAGPPSKNTSLLSLCVESKGRDTFPSPSSLVLGSVQRRKRQWQSPADKKQQQQPVISFSDSEDEDEKPCLPSEGVHLHVSSLDTSPPSISSESKGQDACPSPSSLTFGSVQWRKKQTPDKKHQQHPVLSCSDAEDEKPCLPSTDVRPSSRDPLLPSISSESKGKNTCPSTSSLVLDSVQRRKKQRQHLDNKHEQQPAMSCSGTEDEEPYLPSDDVCSSFHDTSLPSPCSESKGQDACLSPSSPAVGPVQRRKKQRQSPDKKRRLHPVISSCSDTEEELPLSSAGRSGVRSSLAQEQPAASQENKVCYTCFVSDVIIAIIAILMLHNIP